MKLILPEIEMFVAFHSNYKGMQLSSIGRRIV